MEGLNYHHLLYFRVVAREGSIARASEKLKISQPTISEQVRTLEEQTGTALFTRQGRHLVLTEAGRTALRYAEDIHSLGDELMGALHEQPRARQQKLSFGLSDGLPTVLASKVAGAFSKRHVRCNVVRGESQALLNDVVTGSLDIVLSDSVPLSRQALLVHKAVSLSVIIAAAPSLGRKHKASFPKSLADEPLAMPPSATRLGRLIEDWFRAKKINPLVVAESADYAVIESLALEGRALLACAGEAPRGLVEVGRLDRAKLDIYLVANARASAQVKSVRQALGRKAR